MVVTEEPTPLPCGFGTHIISGTGTLTGQTNPSIDSVYTYIGAGTLDGNDMGFFVDQQVINGLGETHIITQGSFDITTGLGTSTVTSCTGEVLVCAGVAPLIGKPAATVDYIALNLDASDPDNPRKRS